MSATATAPQSRPSIDDLAPGTPIDAIFTCVEAAKLLTNAGKPFLVAWLTDERGTWKGTAFDYVEELPVFEMGDRVRVRGRVREYAGRNQLRIDQIVRTGTAPDPDPPAVDEPPVRLAPAGEGDQPLQGASALSPPPAEASRAADNSPGAAPAATLPATHRASVSGAFRDRDELDGYLEALAAEIADPRLRALLDALLANPLLREGLRRAPGVPGVHHSYPGGLLEHTVAVARLAQETAQLHPRLDADLLLAAALVPISAA